MENQTLPLPATNSGLPLPTGNENAGLRFTAKTLKHPDTGVTLREGFAPFDLVVELPFTLRESLSGIEGHIVHKLLGEKIKELVQLKERALWIGGAKPYNPKDVADTAKWWLEELGKVTTQEIGAALFSPVTRATGFGVKRWEQWLKAVFLPTLDIYYSHSGLEVMSAPKKAATLTLMKQGRDMAEHNKAAFAKRFTTLLESDNEQILEAITSEESELALEWLTAEKEKAEPKDLEI